MQRQQWAAEAQAAAEQPQRLPTRYVCMARATIRVGRRLTSRDVGVLERGERLESLEEVTLGPPGAEGSVGRVRFSRGWVSTVSAAGIPILRPDEPAAAAGGEEAESWL